MHELLRDKKKLISLDYSHLIDTYILMDVADICVNAWLSRQFRVIPWIPYTYILKERGTG